MTTVTADPGAERVWPITALVFTAMTIGLFAILANLLNFHHYPLLRPEVALLLLVLTGIAAAATGVHRLAQPRVAFAVTGMLAAFLADLGADLGRYTFPIVFSVVSLIAWRWERIVLKLMITAFASVLLFQTFGLVFGGGAPKPPPNEAQKLQTKQPTGEKLSPVVHLLLDSYIGFDGMSAADTDFGDLRLEQERFYLSRGFQIYPSAYSRHSKTVNAMPDFLSYGQAKNVTEPRNVQFTTAPPLDYFIDLDRKGYRTSALAPSFVDLCANQPLTRCRNYNRNDLTSMLGSELSVLDRARLIGFTMLQLSQQIAMRAGQADLKLARSPNTRRRLIHRSKLYSLTGFQQLDAFSRDIATLDFGEARFVHLLLPHDPHMMDARCKVVAERDWIDEHGPLPIAARDAAYARQVRCMTHGGLTRLMAALEKTEAGRAAVVVIQGDHGSRTVNHLPTAGSSPHRERIMTVTHSALFAIRVPGQAAAKVEGRFALGDLLGGFAATGFTAAPRPVAGPAEVYLMDRRWIPKERVVLPPFTQKSTENVGNSSNP